MAKLAPYVALFFGIIFAFVAVPDAIETLQVANGVDGYRSTRAEVVLQSTHKPERGPEMQIVKFRYKVGKRTYDGDNHYTRAADEKELLEDLVREEKDGKKSILIYYDPDHPKRAVIRKAIPIWFPLGIIGVTLFLLIGSIMSFRTQRVRRRMIERNKPRRD